MKKKATGKQTHELTMADVEQLLHDVLKDEGLLLPRTPEDVANLQASLAGQNFPTPDSKEFRRSLDKIEELKSPSKKLGQLASSVAKKEELALAARSGAGKISETTRKKMDAVWEKRSQRKPKA